MEVLNAIYEEDFLGFSYGFRPGRGQHDALDALAVGITRTKVNWIVDADITGFFDAVSHEWLMRFVEDRIGDRRINRLFTLCRSPGALTCFKFRFAASISSDTSIWEKRETLDFLGVDKQPAASLSELVIRPYPMQYLREWKFADGTPVFIRPIRPEDEPLTIDFHKPLSERLRILRYFGFLKGEALISHERLVQICFSDYDREINLVAERIQPGRNQQQIIAIARLIKSYGVNEAEFAIVISDDWQGKGLGTKLLRDLLEIGCTEGLERIVGYVLPENYVMQRICRKQGFEGEI